MKFATFVQNLALSAMAAGCWDLPAAEAVVAFRNGGTGAFPDADPPLAWSVSTNVKWRWDAPVFGTSIAGPILVGDRVVTLAQPLTLVCLDKDTGEELWRRERHLEKPAGDGDAAFALHAAILRDHRIGVLKSRLGQKRAPTKLQKLADAYRKMGKAKGLADADRAFYEGRAKQFDEVLADGQAKRGAYEKELAALEATVPAEKHAIKASSHLCPSAPASDGERIFALFSPGLLVCYDLAGKLRWTHAVVKEGGGLAKRNWGTWAKVPVVADGKVIAAMGDQVHCLDAATGELRWRFLDKGAHCAASPAIGVAGGRHYVGLARGTVLALADGKEVFKAELSGALRAPLYAQRSVDPERRTLHYAAYALRLTGDAARPVETLWRIPPEHHLAKGMAKDAEPVYGGSHQYCPPVVHDGLVYYLNTHNKRFYSVLDAATGKLLAGPQVGISGATYSDLTLAGDHLFCFQSGKGRGECLVLEAGAEYIEVGRNRLEPLTWNTPLFVGRRMYVRTHRGLFCIEKPESN